MYIVHIKMLYCFLMGQNIDGYTSTSLRNLTGKILRQLFRPPVLATQLESKGKLTIASLASNPYDICIVHIVKIITIIVCSFLKHNCFIIECAKQYDQQYQLLLWPEV